MTTSLESRFRSAQTFDEMLASATKNVELYTAIRARATADADVVSRLAATGRRWHLLVISEDWCGDAVNIVPFLDALNAASDTVEVRILARDQNLDLMDQHLTNGVSRSIPIVLVLDDQYVERAWWGPRPQALQAWFQSPEAQAMTKDDRYRELRKWYARDRGRTTLQELATMIEGVAADSAVCA